MNQRVDSMSIRSGDTPLPAMPIISLALEGMKVTIRTALTEYRDRMDENIKQAVDEFCKPENIQPKINQMAADALAYALREEVDAFFRHGPGRKVVAAAVKESLLNNESYTVVDDVDKRMEAEDRQWKRETPPERSARAKKRILKSSAARAADEKAKARQK